MRYRSILGFALLVGLSSAGLGCFAVAKRSGDLDRAPVVNHGAGATVIYPGQAPPPHPGDYHPRHAPPAVAVQPAAPTPRPRRPPPTCRRTRSRRAWPSPRPSTSPAAARRLRRRGAAR